MGFIDSVLRISPQGIFLWVVGILLLWLALREVRTWYWKINDVIALLKKIEENTKK